MECHNDHSCRVPPPRFGEGVRGRGLRATGPQPLPPAPSPKRGGGARLAIVLVFGCALAQPIRGQEKPSTAIDVVYGKAGERALKLDIARPPADKGKGPFPTVVCVHGGGWRMGDKGDLREWIQLLAREGYDPNFGARGTHVRSARLRSGVLLGQQQLRRLGKWHQCRHHRTHRRDRPYRRH